MRELFREWSIQNGIIHVSSFRMYLLDPGTLSLQYILKIKPSFNPLCYLTNLRKIWKNKIQLENVERQLLQAQLQK